MQQQIGKKCMQAGKRQVILIAVLQNQRPQSLAILAEAQHDVSATVGSAVTLSMPMDLYCCCKFLPRIVFNPSNYPLNAKECTVAANSFQEQSLTLAINPFNAKEFILLLQIPSNTNNRLSLTLFCGTRHAGFPCLSTPRTDRATLFLRSNLGTVLF